MVARSAQANDAKQRADLTVPHADSRSRTYRSFQPGGQAVTEISATTSDASILRVLGIKPAKHYHSLTDWVRRGLPATSVDRLVRALDISQKDLSGIIDIPVPTLLRRKKQKQRLTTAESDRVVRIAKILQQAIDMMHGDEQAARRWLLSPKQILAGETPLQRASTEAGAREVEQLIGRTRHGVFS